MHRIRVLLAILIGLLIIWWLTKRYQQHPDRKVVDDPLQPVWDKVAAMINVFNSSSVSDTGSVIRPSKRNTTKSPFHADFSTGLLQVQQLNTIINPATIHGVASPEIVLLQYCDFGSPYCIQGHEEGAIASYLEAFPDQLGYIYKPYPRNLDAETVLPHQAAVCVQQLGSKEQYLAYYDKLYTYHDTLDPDALISYADQLGIDWFEDCLRSHNALIIQQEMKTGRELFNFDSLPADILIDTTNGRRVLVPGLYEIKEVIPAVQRLLQQR